jgi:hypothetical protein
VKNTLSNLVIAIVAGLMVIEIGAVIERWHDMLTRYAPYALLGILVFCAWVAASAAGTFIALRILRRQAR